MRMIFILCDDNFNKVSFIINLMLINKQCFQKYIKCTSNANDAGNASVSYAVNTDDAACDVNADGAANVTGW
jgi:hypothetical protein